jgi:hypothetical protein
MLKYQHNKSLLVVGTTVLIVLGLRLGSFVSSYWIGSVDPHIRLQENKSKQIAEKQHQQQASAFFAVADGEVSRTEERIREATALASVAGIYTASETIRQRQPQSASSILSDLSREQLMPPGMSLIPSSSQVVTQYSRLLLRYRWEPLSIEVVSIGKLSLDGPAVLIRLESTGVANPERPNAALYVATTLVGITAPPDFAPEAQLIALGFAPEPLRAARIAVKEERKSE